MHKYWLFLGFVCVSTNSFRTSEETAVGKILSKIQAEGNSNDLEAFFRAMPKGGDLHHHVTGASWAENLIDLASDMNLCVNTITGKLAKPPCDVDSTAIRDAYDDNVLYTHIVEHWSLRSANGEGTYVAVHDHFFAIFDDIGLSVQSIGRILTLLLERAAAEKVAYLETMVVVQSLVDPLHVLASSLLGSYDACNVKNYDAMWGELSGSEGFQAIAKQALVDLASYVAVAEKELRCGTPLAHAGCSVAVKWVYYVMRSQHCQEVFAETALAFAVAEASRVLASSDAVRTAGNNATLEVVGINMVGPEDAFRSRRNYTAHMMMIKHLAVFCPHVPVALHAGELRLGMVPPEDMTFHISEAVNVAGAKRVGHGVSITFEPDWDTTMAKMAATGVAMEINLSSNEELLQIAGDQHPLPVYLRRGVPVVLSTDDPGIMRVDLSSQFAIAAERYPGIFNYSVAKEVARNSLEYSFLPGFSLWAPASGASQSFITPVGACTAIVSNPAAPSPSCAAACTTSQRATMQLALEEALAAFEKLQMLRW